MLVNNQDGPPVMVLYSGCIRCLTRILPQHISDPQEVIEIQARAHTSLLASCVGRRLAPTPRWIGISNQTYLNPGRSV